MKNEVGNRNNKLTRIAGYWRKRGADRDILYGKLNEENTKFSDPLPKREIDSIIISMLRYRPDFFDIEIDEAAYNPVIYETTKLVSKLLPEFYEPVSKEPLPKYLVEKGISLDLALKYKIGYCNIGKYAKRTIFPVEFNNEVVTFVAFLDSSMRCDSVRKSLMPFGSNIKDYLYNYDNAITYDCVVLVEGIADTLAVGDWAMGLFGKTMSNKQFNLLINSGIEDVVVCLDSDAKDETLRLANMLKPFFNVKVLLLDDGDPSDHRYDIQQLLLTKSIAIGALL